MVMTLKNYSSTSLVRTSLTLTRFKSGEQNPDTQQLPDVPMADLTIPRGRPTTNEVLAAPAVPQVQQNTREGQEIQKIREVSPTPYQPHTGGVMTLHWAPFRGASLLGLTEFIEWIKQDDQVPMILRASFARASPTPSGLIKTVVITDEQLALTKAYFGAEGKFVLISEFPEQITIAEMKKTRLRGGEPMLLSPIQIGQLPDTMRPSEVATMIKNRGEHPMEGVVSNLRKVGNSYEGRVWHPLKRAQIFRNALSQDGSYIRLSPGQLGNNEIDNCACVIRNEGVDAETEEIQHYIAKYATNAPKPLAIAQYRNSHTNETIQKWIICFGTPDQAKQFANSTAWVQEVQEAKLEVKPCRGPVVNSKSQAFKGMGRTLNKK
jgi:hypothetical protein